MEGGGGLVASPSPEGKRKARDRKAFDDLLEKELGICRIYVCVSIICVPIYNSAHLICIGKLHRGPTGSKSQSQYPSIYIYIYII